MKLLIKFGLSLAFLVAPIAAFADVSELTITDSAGVTRSVSQVEGASHIEFTLTDVAGMPADGVQVTLTNAATGEQISAVVVNGTVAFDQVAAGTWTVSSAAANVTFTNIVVTAASAGVGLGAAGLGGTTILLAGGGVAAAAGATIAIVDANDSNNNGELSPSS